MEKNEYIILDNLKQSIHWAEGLDTTEENEKIDYPWYFTEDLKSDFLKEVARHTPDKQTGYSKSRQADYLSLVIVFSCFDETGTSLFVSSTCLLKTDEKVIDSNKKPDSDNNDDDLIMSVRTAYHMLPSGKYLEIRITEHYEANLEEIYAQCLSTRRYYDLDSQLTTKADNIKKRKI